MYPSHGTLRKDSSPGSDPAKNEKSWSNVGTNPKWKVTWSRELYYPKVTEVTTKVEETFQIQGAGET